MTNLEKTKWIDRYLLQEMSEKERNDFERLLSEDLSSYDGKLTLREEMELQRDIECAIQERGLRDMLLQRETQIRRKQRTKRIMLWSLSSGGVIMAVAALIILLCVVAPIAHMMQDYSTNYVVKVEISSVRGGDTCTQELNNALRLMQKGQWDDAFTIVDNVLLQTTKAQDEATREMYYNAEWLKAICLMHNGQVIKAKRLLRKIADGNSDYKQQAIELLEQF